eukprot:CAMPEP_0172784152 /NCGR_PEP_ID=MMETSP1074-20121228/204798_1 /TAXON_ID=2916 /ORGANISM="Ceratium fusus, Strain PA161109" /LENGTH=686 /DNA_ID=CAMNT_0013621153 /DNA_START=46 /DNA_END=2106 /DNA_ORIENTATION=+
MMPHTKDWGVVLGKLEIMQRQLEQVLQQQEWLMIRVSSNQSKKTFETDTGTNFAEIDSPGDISALQCEVSPRLSTNRRVRSTWSSRLTKTSMSDAQGNNEKHDKENKKRIYIENATNEERLEETGCCNGTRPMTSQESCVTMTSCHSEELVKVSRSSAGRVSVHDEMEQTELQEILSANRQVKSMRRIKSAQVVARLGERLASFKYIKMFAKKKDKKTLDLLVDSFVGVVILANSIFLGLSMDAKSATNGGFLVAEIIFTIIFCVEIILKVRIHGFHEQYYGKEWLSNIFDATIICADAVHVFLIVVFAGNYSATFNASIFRVVRLVRLARILRILRSKVFKDLLSMIHGMLDGLWTLLWAVVFFIIFIYVVALIFRDTLGHGQDNVEDNEDAKLVQLYFSSVPMAMYTLFRCSFGECDTRSGTPLFEHVATTHGRMWTLIYSMFLFVVVIGLFNVISAIFVESTMSSNALNASKVKQERLVVIGLFNVISAIFVESTMSSAALLASRVKQERLDNKDRWAENVVTLLRSFLVVAWPDMEGLDGLAEGRYTERMLSELVRISFPRSVIDKVVHEDEQALQALTKLDIDPSDHNNLSDILDPGNTGSVSIVSLVDGLKRLRGEPRRSDIITVDLMIRSSQQKVDDIWQWTKQMRRSHGMVLDNNNNNSNSVNNGVAEEESMDPQGSL